MRLYVAASLARFLIVRSAIGQGEPKLFLSRSDSLRRLGELKEAFKDAEEAIRLAPQVAKAIPEIGADYRHSLSHHALLYTAPLVPRPVQIRTDDHPLRFTVLAT